MSHLFNKKVIKLNIRSSQNFSALKQLIKRTGSSNKFNDCENGGDISHLPRLDDLIQDEIKRIFTIDPAIDRSYLLEYAPKSQDELPPRTIRDSFLSARIPLSTDKILVNKYVSFENRIRTGRLMEDMDIFSALISNRYICLPNKPKDIPTPLCLVTAAVDKIIFKNYYPRITLDVKISGHIVSVGKTSMEILISLEQYSDNTWNKLLEAYFLFVARDILNKKSVPVNPLAIENEEDKTMAQEAEKRKQVRKTRAKLDVFKIIPNQEELILLHKLYTKRKELTQNIRHVTLPDNYTSMHKHQIQNAILAMPEHRNLHNTIFGGYAMRKAAELSFLHAYFFAHERPQHVSVSNIIFKKPILINSIIQMKSHIGYTLENFIQTKLYIEMVDPNNLERDTTTVIHFTYKVTKPVLKMMPMSYHDAIIYIDSRRHFLDLGLVSQAPQKE